MKPINLNKAKRIITTLNIAYILLIFLAVLSTLYELGSVYAFINLLIGYLRSICSFVALSVLFYLGLYLFNRLLEFIEKKSGKSDDRTVDRY